MVRFIIILLLIIIGVLWYLSYKRGNPKNRMPGDNGATHAEEFNPYKVLQVPRDATQEEIHKAWVELAAQYHPDKAAHLGPDLQALAEKRFKEIQRAYEILKRD